MRIALMLGSAPNALDARAWPRAPFDHIVTINNAWRIRDDWDDLCCPWDFPEDKRPTPQPNQRLILQENFVPTQNLYGGFVYIGFSDRPFAAGTIANPNTTAASATATNPPSQRFAVVSRPNRSKAPITSRHMGSPIQAQSAAGAYGSILTKFSR